jgi:uncharacterized protein
MTKTTALGRVSVLIAALAMAATAAANAGDQAAYSYREVMIPMRDGVRLQTVIVTPLARSAALPILLRRTPYGVPEDAEHAISPDLAELARDGYVFAIQNVRGRFKSEGTFAIATQVNAADRGSVNEATDAYDTVDWLVKNVPENNGRVGIFGVSYAGLTAALALLYPHPALRAVSEQAASGDQWMNDDFHHYGALRESYAFEYAVMEQAAKEANSHFSFDVYDTYEWYLTLGPLSNVNARFLHGTLPFWNNIVAHPDYDAYWRQDAWIRQLHGSPVPVLNVAGFWDQEDPFGPWDIFRRLNERGRDAANFMVAGPWYHGSWRRQVRGDQIGQLPLEHPTAAEFRATLEAPFFRYYLHGSGPHGSGARPDFQVATFQTGSDAWRHYPTWPPPGAITRSLYLQANGTLSFDPPPPSTTPAYREYLSDPRNPVPYRQRPISPIYPGGDWPTWEVADQRFVDHRPDVLTYVSAPLEHDLVVTGPIRAELFASTSGTDSDFVVKLIDVYPQDAERSRWPPEQGPEPGEYAHSLNGYELPIAMEIRRGRYLGTFDHPTALTANRPALWPVPLGDHDHVFRRGHRLMVQIQSTWFPLFDRNPQRFVANIYTARAGDFGTATQRVYSSPAQPSRIDLSVVPR